MDKIWYRNPSKSEVIGRCGGDEKTTQNRQKSNAKLKKQTWLKLLSYVFDAYTTFNRI